MKSTNWKHRLKRYGLLLFVFMSVSGLLGWLVKQGDGLADAAPTSATLETYELHRVADINQMGSGSVPRGLADLNGRLYFRADDGINGLEL